MHPCLPPRRHFVPTLVLALAFLPSPPATADFRADLGAAITAHDAADTLEAEVQVLENLRELTREHPGEWLAPYWGSYIATQIARLQGRVDDFPSELDPKALIREALELQATARERWAGGSEREHSSLVALRAFLHQWEGTFLAETDQERAGQRQAFEAQLAEAARIDPRNPILLVFEAIDQMGRRDDPGDAMDLAGAIGLFDHAEEVMAKAREAGPTLYWNWDFIAFWRSRAEAALAGAQP